MDTTRWTRLEYFGGPKDGEGYFVRLPLPALEVRIPLPLGGGPLVTRYWAENAQTPRYGTYRVDATRAFDYLTVSDDLLMSFRGCRDEALGYLWQRTGDRPLRMRWLGE
jgi:hypothetical protein